MIASAGKNSINEDISVPMSSPKLQQNPLGSNSAEMRRITDDLMYQSIRFNIYLLQDPSIRSLQCSLRVLLLKIKI